MVFKKLGLIILALLLTLGFRAYSENTKIVIPEQTEIFYITKFFLSADNVETLRYPTFINPISLDKTKNTKDFFKVYYLKNKMVGYEKVENGVTISKTIIRPEYTLYTKYDFEKKPVRYAILYYKDDTNKIKRKEVFDKGKNLIYYNVYHYNWLKKKARVDVYNAGGKLVYVMLYVYDKTGKLVSIDRKKVADPYNEGLEITKPRPSQIDDLQIKDDVKVQLLSVKGYYSSETKDFRINGKIVNLSDKALYEVYVSVDLYNDKSELVDTILGYSSNGADEIMPGETITFETARTLKYFNSARIFIHYRSTKEGKLEYYGPLVISYKALKDNKF